MTFATATIIEAETLTEVVEQLALEQQLERETGLEYPVTDNEVYENTGALPVTVLEEVLAAADGTYYYDAPRTGGDPRYRVFEFQCGNVTN